MPTYRYELQQEGGKLLVGQLTAESATGAASALKQYGGKILHLVPLATAKSGFKSKLGAIMKLGSGPSSRDVLDFTTQLAVMVRAGISLRAAIEGIAANNDNKIFKEILHSIKEDIEAGSMFSDAIEKYPKLFSPLYINMVRASELSGSFGHMLDRIAKIITRQIETKKMIISASIYPGVIGGLATCVTIFLLIFVLPRFASVFEGKESVLPWPTIFLMGLSAWMVVYWWIVPVVIGALTTAIVYASGTRKGKVLIDVMKLRVPVLRKMLRALYISRSLQTFGELINSGVPMLNALEVTGNIAGNRKYFVLWNEVKEGVKDGQRIHDVLKDTPLLPKPVVQMISAGEESGRLGDVLEEVSEYYERVLRDAVRTFTSLIEPTMIVCMGVVVGFIAMAIILPIFKMSAVVAG